MARLRAIPEPIWTPVRRGRIYCSSACGGECTWAAYQKAKHDAEALAKKLGKGWKPRLNENLGWHWSVVKGGMEVCRYSDGTYHAGLYGGTPAEIYVSGYFKNPQAAISAQLQTIEDVVRKWREFAENFKKGLE